MYAFKLRTEAKKLVWETSFRFMAALTEEGGVEVYKVKGESEKYQWQLGFHSVGDIMNNPYKENQFAVTMNSEEKLLS